MHPSTARHVADLELVGVGADLPQVSSGPVQAESTAFDRPHHLRRLRGTNVLELETVREPRSVEDVTSPACEAVMLFAARARLVWLDG